MGRLIIHAGYPKVASTFLQDQLLVRMTSANVLLNKGGILLGNKDNSRSLWFEPERRAEELKLLREQCISNPQPTIISHESLCVGNWMKSYDQCEHPDVVAERIGTHLPEAEILLILRPQSNWFGSWYRQHVSGGLESPPEAMLDTEVWKERVRPALEYDKKIQQYQHILGKDRVRVFYYSDLVENQDRFVKSILDYVGVAGPLEFPRIPLNVTRSDPIIRAKLVSNRASAYLRNHLVRSPEGRAAWDRAHHQLWKRYLNRADFLVKRFAKKATIPPELAQRIDEMFAESNARLEHLVGEDLRAKGFHVAPIKEGATSV